MTHPLTSFRRTNDLTLREFAAAIGATKGMVSKWEAAKALPRAHYLSAIENLTGGQISIGELVRAYHRAHPAKQGALDDAS